MLLQLVILGRTSDNRTLEGKKTSSKDKNKERRERKGRHFAFIGTISCSMCYNLAQRLL
jgi:hypothetical protein